MLYKNRDWLCQKYSIEKLSAYKIAEICSCGNRTIYRWLEIFGIKTRTLNEAMKGRIPWNKNKKWSEKIKKKFRKAHAGKVLSENHKKNIGKAIKGRKLTEKHRRNLSASSYWKGRKGELHPSWKNGLSFLPYPVEFKYLRKEIRKRDNYQCQFCGIKENGRQLPVHHIDYEKENLDEFNLITLCDPHNLRANTDRSKWQFLFETIQELRFTRGLI